MDIELHFTQEDKEQGEEIKQYAYESIEAAAYFMGLLQQGIRYGGEMFVMEDHYLDVDSNTVIVLCITVKEAEKKLAAQRKQMLKDASPEFLNRLRPAFKTDDGCGGCDNEGGGFLN